MNKLLEIANDPKIIPELLTIILKGSVYDDAVSPNEYLTAVLKNPNIDKKLYLDYIAYDPIASFNNPMLSLWLLENPSFLSDVDSDSLSKLFAVDFEKWNELVSINDNPSNLEKIYTSITESPAATTSTLEKIGYYALAKLNTDADNDEVLNGVLQHKNISDEFLLHFIDTKKEMYHYTKYLYRIIVRENTSTEILTKIYRILKEKNNTAMVYKFAEHVNTSTEILLEIINGSISGGASIAFSTLKRRNSNIKIQIIAE